MNTIAPSDRIKASVDNLLTPLSPKPAPAPAPANTPSITVTGNDNVVATGNITINQSRSKAP